MKWQDYIHSDPNVLAGKPIIKGTRLSVEFLLGRMADGWTEQMILENYPWLTKEALQAIHLFVYDIFKNDSLQVFISPFSKAS
jgi:uncharacterized protein (DUF433 family)